VADRAPRAVVHVGPWTEEDLLGLPDDGQRHEILEGSLVVSPPPAGQHQGAASRLLRRLAEHAPPRLEVVEALGVRAPAGSILVPDVLVVESEALWANGSGILEPSAVHLVVEIVSPGSVTMDRLSKPALYAQARIPSFWRVELGQGPSVFAHRLEGGSYVAEASAAPGGRLVVQRPFPVDLDPGELIR
jgi:Uma2 family endonuclease